MKKLLAMFLVVVLISAAMLSMPVFVSAESLYVHKIVSVVYDDSGSMSGNKWAYANYAMQTFCGMLNSDDQLFITYMSKSLNNSNYNPEKIDLSAAGIQNSVDSIRNHKKSSSTPYSAVEKAFNKLKSVNDSNPNTQYWLVVITDGEFDECSNMSKDKKKSYLNDHFYDYAESVMPNGTEPQVTFLGIGDIVSPDEDQTNGVYTYSASDAAGIIKAMSDMADKISGRTRLQAKDIKKIDDKTIQVSSSIPLLNVAVFAQGSQVKVTKAEHSNKTPLSVNRNVSLSYPGHSELVGGAFLLESSSDIIDSGKYNITFDSSIDVNDIIILFEPAIEVRMTISVNGTEISDRSKLSDVMEKDKISVSCKIYEMETNTEIDPSDLPSGTKFEITVYENGQVSEQKSGKDMVLSDYALKNVDTKITGAVTINGFDPIEDSVEFTPQVFVQKTNYSITADYSNGIRNVKIDEIAANKDLAVCFTVNADAVAITDPAVVKSLNPVISVSPQGNDGDITYSDDGKIIFTPNSANVPASNTGSFDVSVTCTLDDGTTASLVYTVLISSYQVVAADAVDSVKKTELFNNKVAVSFYITKDGVKLDKTAVENGINVALSEGHQELKTDIVVSDDGTITVTPYSQEEHTLTFWNWWINWAYYFGLEGQDITVTMNHSLGTANALIDITEEDVAYQILNVYLPLVIEIVILVLLITWIILIVTKPRYVNSATLFVGDIKYNKENSTHILKNFSAVNLSKFNKIKRGNGRLKFKKNADVVCANGINIRADHGGRIICEMPFPWYKCKIEPADTDFSNLKTPAAIADYIEKHRKLEINEFVTTVTVDGEFNRGLTPSNPRIAKYIAVPDSGNSVSVIDGRKVIKSGRVFMYIN